MPKKIVLSYLLLLVSLVAIHAQAEEDEPTAESKNPPLTLTKLLEAVHEHPEIKVDQLNIGLAEVDRNQAYLRFAPSANITQNSTSENDPDTIKRVSSQIYAGINVFRGLQDFTNLRAQRSALAATREERRSKLLDSTQTAAELYFTCLQLDKSESEARLALDIRRQIAAIEKGRFEKGVRSKDDFTKLDLDAHNAELDLKRYVTRSRVCLTQLSYWVGPVDEVTELTFEPLVAKELSTPPPADLDLSHHPDWQAISKWREKADWDLRRAQGAFLPTVDFSFSSYPRTDFQDSSHQWLLTARFNLLEPGDTMRDIQRNRVIARMMEQQEFTVRRKLTMLAQQRRAELRNAYTQFQGQRRNLELAQQLLASSLRRFRSGAISANDVAFDQNRVVQSQFNYHDYWLQMNLAWIRYQAAQGVSPEDFLQN